MCASREERKFGKLRNDTAIDRLQRGENSLNMLKLEEYGLVLHL